MARLATRHQSPEQQLVETYERIGGDLLEIAALSIEPPHRGVSIRNRSCIFIVAIGFRQKMQGIK
jgi:hypothetical protein